MFAEANAPLLNIYFTAGFPHLEDTGRILKALQDGGADMVEIGMPYSDPLADGEIIQKSSSVALQNGMTIEKLFEQLENIRSEVDIPLVLMGYLNPVMQYGVKAFCQKCQQVGIDGLIIPDLPMELFDSEFKGIFQEAELDFVFLVTPETSDERISEIDKRSTGFIYLVSSSSTTGKTIGFGEEQLSYFERIKSMNLKNKTMVGFGISNRETFIQACETADGAIIGSAFIKQLAKDSSEEGIRLFIQEIKK